MPYNFTFITSLFLASCGEDWRTQEGGADGAAGKREVGAEWADRPPLHGRILLKDEKITDVTPLYTFLEEPKNGLPPFFSIEEAAAVLVTVRGKRFSPVFSVRAVPHDGNFQPVYFDYCGPAGKKVPCPPPPSYPDCTYNFGTYEGDASEDIVFPDDTRTMNLKLRIGDVLFPLGEVVHHGGTEITARFVVTAEAIERASSGAISLRVIPEGDRGNERVGFLGFAEGADECPGIDGEDGRFGVREMEGRSRREYTVTVSATMIEEGGETEDD